MQKNSLTVIVAGVVLLLSGCQSDSVSSIGNFGSIFSPYPSGVTLAQSVQDALVQSGDPVLAQVHVETIKNDVLLSGYVKKIRQSDTAEMITRKVPGVQNVQNNLIVRQ